MTIQRYMSRWVYKKGFDGMMTLSDSSTIQQIAKNSGHHFDANRRWAAFLTLGFGAHADGDTHITRMNIARHYVPYVSKDHSTLKVAMVAVMSICYIPQVVSLVVIRSTSMLL